MKELLKAILEKVKALKKVGDAGFSNEKDAAEYFKEREFVIEDIAKALEAINDSYDSELAALKSQIGEIIKRATESREPVELTKDKYFETLGKFVRSAWRKDTARVAELGAVLNTKEKSEDWDDQHSVIFDKAAGRFMRLDKASIGNPVGSAGDGTYIINTIMERELIRYALEWSDMMGKVRSIPMNAKTISWPTLNRHKPSLFWLNAYGDTIGQAGKPSFGTRVELDAKTLAGYIPWFDEFEDDIQINIALGQLFNEMFMEAYASEFDRQVLTANSDPYKGLFAHTGAGECIKRYVAGTSPFAVTMEDLKAMPLAIPRADRVRGVYILNEDAVSYLISLRNSQGDFLIQPPNDNSRPGRLCGYPYIEAKQAPSISDTGKGKPFIWFGDPMRTVWHGNRKGIEIRTFTETTESLLNGEQFIRFRKRDAFKVVQPDLSVLLCTRE